MTRILVVDDEPQILRAMATNLRARGYEVELAPTGEVALTIAARKHPDLVVLDLGLPGIDGIEVIRGLRGWTKVPIIVLSVREAETDKVAALDAGADDYVTKPFGMDELLARLRAALRRAAPAEEEAVVETGSFTRRPRRQAGHDAGAGEVRLTPTEWHIVEILVRNAGKLVTQRQLLQEVWGPQYEKETNYLRVYLAQIRAKLEPDPARPRYFITEARNGLPLRAGASRGLTFAGHPVTMGGRMAVEVVGRDEELSSLSAFLDRRAAVAGPDRDRAGGRGRDREVDALARGRRGRARARASACSRRGRPSRSARSRTPASATCSTASSTTSCRP